MINYVLKGIFNCKIMIMLFIGKKKGGTISKFAQDFLKISLTKI